MRTSANVTFKITCLVQVSSRQWTGTRTVRFLRGQCVTGRVRHHVLQSNGGPTEVCDIDCEDGRTLRDVWVGYVTIRELAGSGRRPGWAHWFKPVKDILGSSPALIWACAFAAFVSGSVVFHSSDEPLVPDPFAHKAVAPDRIAENAPRAEPERRATSNHSQKAQNPKRPPADRAIKFAGHIPDQRDGGIRVAANLTGEAVYQVALRSVAFVEADHNPNTLANATWLGKEDRPGLGTLTFQFQADGRATLVESQGTSAGTWQLMGNQVRLEFVGRTYEGTLVNASKEIYGSARATDTGMTWRWSVSFRNQTARSVTGSGAIIDARDNLLITTEQVVGPAERIAVFFPRFDRLGNLITSPDAYTSAHAIRGKVVLVERASDLALIQLDNRPPDSEALPIADVQLKPGQEAHFVRNPATGGALWARSQGKIREVRTDKWSSGPAGSALRFATRIELNAPVDLADNGGPLLNSQGELIGLESSFAQQDRSIGTFIASSEVRRFVELYYQLHKTR